MKNILLSFLFLIFTIASLLGQERITSYDVEIDVQKDRSILVVENIEVFVTGNKIKRGITRTFPTHRELMGQSVSLDIEELSVTKDGTTEPFHITEGNSGKVLYIGKASVYLEKGLYKYVISYRVPGQIGSYEDYDEIYWNVIGNDVEFNVEKAKCTLRLPEGVKAKQTKAYTGYFGKVGSDYRASNNENEYQFELTRALKPKESFTVAVGFDKDVVEPLSFWSRFGTLLILAIGGLGLLAYYLSSWWKFGRDPVKPEFELIYHPPDKISPAAMSYIHTGYSRNTQFSSSIVALAVKGFINIKEVELRHGLHRNFELVKLKDSDTSLQDDLDYLHRELFKKRKVVVIDGSYDAHIKQVTSGFSSFLRSNYRSFLQEGHNVRLVWPPLIATILIFFAAVVNNSYSIFSPSSNLLGLVVFFILGIIAMALYMFLIRKPTPEKLEIRARIKAFKEFLTIKEADKLAENDLPELTVEHYEEILPYAIALGVEHKLSERFRDHLKSALYVPTWTNTPNIYHDRSFSRGLSSSIASTVIDPTVSSSSGSGSSGGGFSGGGGGGGGVGGW